MIINQATLANMYTAFSTVFNNAFAGALSFYDQLAMTVPSGSRTMDYKFLLQFPMLREWIGDRQIRSLAGSSYQITNKDFEGTIEVDRNDIADDQLGIFNPMVAELARAAKQHPDLLVAALMAAGTATLGYDGKYFFATDHQVAGANVSNYGGGASTQWYLLDTSRAIKPFIFQSRQSAQLVSQDNPESENAFMRKKFRYGVDYRGNVGYGLWQLAYSNKTALTASLYATARAAMMSFKNDEGVPLGITPTLLVVPPSLEAVGREILEADLIGVTGEGTKTNVWKGTAKLLVVPWLS